MHCMLLFPSVLPITQSKRSCLASSLGFGKKHKCSFPEQARANVTKREEHRQKTTTKARLNLVSFQKLCAETTAIALPIFRRRDCPSVVRKIAACAVARFSFRPLGDRRGRSRDSCCALRCRSSTSGRSISTETTFPLSRSAAAFAILITFWLERTISNFLLSLLLKREQF